MDPVMDETIPTVLGGEKKVFLPLLNRLFVLRTSTVKFIWILMLHSPEEQLLAAFKSHNGGQRTLGSDGNWQQLSGEHAEP